MHRPDRPHRRRPKALVCSRTQRISRTLISETVRYRLAEEQTGVDAQAPPPAAPRAQEQEAAHRPTARLVALRSVPLLGTPELVQPLARLPVLCVVDASRKSLRRRLASKPLNRQGKLSKQSQAQATAEYQGKLDTFKRAFSACMDARIFNQVTGGLQWQDGSSLKLPLPNIAARKCPQVTIF
jgi:hypothetical protein